jgi:glycosyltransferase involved in cell wall biosynthesis
MNENKFAFSIVLPLYNKEKHILRAILSVLQQSYQEFELIIVNDGSTDASVEKAMEIIDPRINIIHQKNRGVSAARNRGVAETRYELLAFLDADDEWLPEFLENMTFLIKKFPESGLYGSSHYRVEKNQKLTVSSLYSEIPLGWLGVFDSYFDQIGSILPYHSSSVCIPREKFLKVGGFKEGVSYWEDTDLWMRLALEFPVAFVNKPLSIYHLDAENRSIHHIKNHCQILNTWEDMVIKNEIPEKHRTTFVEFLARYQLMFGKIFLKNGYNQQSKEILTKIKSNSKYYNESIKLMKLAKLPSFLSKNIIRLINRLKYTSKKIEDYYGL